VRIRGIDEWCRKRERSRKKKKKEEKGLRGVSVRYVGVHLDRSDSDSSLLRVRTDRDCKVMREGEWGGCCVEMACPV
jgi:hypothetical protein